MSKAYVGGTASVDGGGAGRGLSPKIWGNKSLYLDPNPENGIFVMDNFHNFQIHNGATVDFVTSAGAYQGYVDSGCTIAQVDGDEDAHGVVRLATDTTDDDECALRFGGDTTTLGMFSDAAAEKAFTCFECRVKTNSITDGVAGMLIGMVEGGLNGDAADQYSNATADLADIDFIGFHFDEDDCDNFDTVHNLNGGGGMTTVKADAAIDTSSVATSLVAATWYKFGFVYDPSHVDGPKFRYVFNNTYLPDEVTATTFGSTFPDAQHLTPIWALRNDTGGAAKQLDIDWWAFGQYLV